MWWDDKIIDEMWDKIGLIWTVFQLFSWMVFLGWNNYTGTSLHDFAFRIDLQVVCSIKNQLRNSDQWWSPRGHMVTSLVSPWFREPSPWYRLGLGSQVHGFALILGVMSLALLCSWEPSLWFRLGLGGWVHCLALVLGVMSLALPWFWAQVLGNSQRWFKLNKFIICLSLII